MALFENYEGRMPQIQPVLDKYGFKDFDEVKALRPPTWTAMPFPARICSCKF